MSDIETRFWQKVIRASDDECWEWQAYKNPAGYGTLHCIVEGKRTNLLSHRISWELHNGPIPPGLFVLHKCDNPACVNPHHLFIGTQSDNIADMMKKRRQSKGTGRPQAKLSEMDISAIRRLCADGVPQNIIARRFGVDQSNISLINTRRTWACQ